MALKRINKELTDLGRYVIPSKGWGETPPSWASPTSSAGLFPCIKIEKSGG